MKAWVRVGLKPVVLDPQGQTIQAALQRLGYSGVAGVRQGKLFEIELAPGTARAEAEQQLERAARDVLSNPVIEEYTIRIEE